MARRARADASLARGSRGSARPYWHPMPMALQVRLSAGLSLSVSLGSVPQEGNGGRGVAPFFSW